MLDQLFEFEHGRLSAPNRSTADSFICMLRRLGKQVHATCMFTLLVLPILHGLYLAMRLCDTILRPDQYYITHCVRMLRFTCSILLQRIVDRAFFRFLLCVFSLRCSSTVLVGTMSSWIVLWRWGSGYRRTGIVSFHGRDGALCAI